jgi:hypothetical protein
MAPTTAKFLMRDPVLMTLRIDAALLQQLQESAKRSFRSVNAEINHRLCSSLEHQADRPSAA